ncbi:MAG: hypothetical protein CMP07_09380 [Xanthomonadales bacterium]|nr:hypothetical protein [Xanthomonadales bacterium]
MLQQLKDATNRILRPLNMQVQTLTAERRDDSRLRELEQRGHFEKPIFPLLRGMSDGSLKWVADAARAHAEDLHGLMSGSAVPGKFCPKNDYLRGSDAEMLYLFVRTRRPRRIVEIGVGNSTRVIRQAIADGNLKVKHIAIDPEPRIDIDDASDQLVRKRLEDLAPEDQSRVFSSLESGDILFLDSSHEVRLGNDVVHLFCNILPTLKPGVCIHVHDIFLPYEYPWEFAWNYRSWNEQYLLQVFLAASGREVLWPGFYLRQCREQDFRSIPFASGHEIRPQSLWFRS